jgi:hypothetical protein
VSVLASTVVAVKKLGAFRTWPFWAINRRKPRDVNVYVRRMRSARAVKRRALAPDFGVIPADSGT